MAEDLSPINSMLTIDILIHIFELNTCMTPYQKGTHYRVQPHSIAFLTLFRGSQVCSLWRDTLTNSPQLWGRAIDLYMFHARQHLPLWNLMLIRSGKAPLHLKARIEDNNASTILPFIATIVETSWERVKSIDIACDSTPLVAWPLSLISPMCERPAPSLVSFRIGYPVVWLWDVIQIQRFPKLPFSGYAPYLQDVFLEHASIDLQTSWGVHIRSFAIQSPKKLLNAVELIQTLSQFPLLESLILFNALDSSLDSAPFLTPLHLPRLQYLSIGDDTFGRPPVVFLASIKTEPGCGLHLDVNDREDLVPFEDLRTALGKFSQQHFDKHPPEELSLCVGKGITITTALSHKTKSVLFVRINDSRRIRLQYCELLEFMEPRHCSSITTLEVRIETESEPDPRQFLALFSRRFQNVQVLRTSIFTFDLWFKLRGYESNPIIFPILREFRVIPRFYLTEKMNPDLFVKFFNFRREHHISIPSFHMPTHDGSGSKWRADIGVAAGLDIHWYVFKNGRAVR